jgi:hypothetical protein
MVEAPDFYYEADPTNELSTEVGSAIAQAHDEDVLEQTWSIADDIDTDALDALFTDRTLGVSLQFEADAATVTITADREGKPVIKIESHR